MTSVPHSEHVRTLIDMSIRSCCAVVLYRKGATRATIRPRLVEPYSFVSGKQDTMIKCWQLEHGGDAEESGWRFFMAHKIDDVQPTSLSFRPKITPTLEHGEAAEVFDQSPHWQSEGRKFYRDLVGDALADGELSEEERADIADLVSKYRLTHEDTRYVHASIYHRCLGSVLDDGMIAAVELDQIRYLHRTMKSLGWAVGD